MGLMPVCAGLRGSATGLCGTLSAASCCWCDCCCSGGMDRASAKGFCVNSVARGDMSASSGSSEEGRAVR